MRTELCLSTIVGGGGGLGKVQENHNKLKMA